MLPPGKLATGARSELEPFLKEQPENDGLMGDLALTNTKHGFLFCVDAHRDGKRFIVKADDLLTAFLSLERDASALKANGKSNQK